jgi:two-component system KDP operon response regulator KdpE
MSGASVLVVEDELHVARAIEAILERDGYRVETVGSVREARDRLAFRAPDLVLLDLMLPDGDGTDLLGPIRDQHPGLPVVVVSAVGDEARKVAALDGGADDYVTKPFGAPELLARVRVALRRRVAHASGDGQLAAGPVTLDAVAHVAAVDGERLALTPTEFGLLRVLLAGQGRVLTHNQLLAEVWGAGYGDETHYLHVHVGNLRRKLRAAGVEGLIASDPGVGYRIAERG